MVKYGVGSKAFITIKIPITFSKQLHVCLHTFHFILDGIGGVYQGWCVRCFFPPPHPIIPGYLCYALFLSVSQYNYKYANRKQVIISLDHKELCYMTDKPVRSAERPGPSTIGKTPGLYNCLCHSQYMTF